MLDDDDDDVAGNGRNAEEQRVYKWRRAILHGTVRIDEQSHMCRDLIVRRAGFVAASQASKQAWERWPRSRGEGRRKCLLTH